jgi:DNA-binding SARP family transcriptional activator/Tfp pilus assembly protein PilF
MSESTSRCRPARPGQPHIAFDVLSRLAVRHGDVWLPLPPPKPRATLATLLLRANEVVPARTLAEILWGDEPPPTAATSLQNHVMRLRRQLGTCVGSRIRTVRPGYVIDVRDGELDLQRFTRLRDSGLAAALHGDWWQAVTDLSEALELFGTGPVLAGLEVPGLHLPDVPRLAEMGLQALEWRIDADLCLGRHQETIAELRRITLMHPFRERFHEQLMLALVRSGRQAEALSAYRDARQAIVDELGVEPGRALQQLHQRIIAADPALHDGGERPQWAEALQPTGRPASAPDAVSAVAQLPASLADFTGRDAQSAELAAWITLAGAGQSGHMPIAAVTGPGGAGKTALALHVAHLVSGQFPSGQLYADLRGGDANAADPSYVLSRFIRELGDSRRAAPPVSGAEEELQAAYRSLLAGRRMLVVLDDARDARQVRPLLPGTGDCAVLITSRSRLTDLDSARILELGMLDEADALALLRRILGDGRVAAEPQAARDVLHACAGLPLAIRIAASRLASRPSWSLRSFADRLADQRSRLDELRSGDRAVRGSFAVTYEALPRLAHRNTVDAARAFRVLGTWSGSSLSLHAAAAMLETNPVAVTAPVEELVDAHLIESVASARYQFHDLLRAYATERAAAEDSPESLSRARDKIVTWYLHTAIAAVHLITPRRTHLPTVPVQGSSRPLAFRGATEALDWLDAEHENLVAATSAAADFGPGAAAWQLPVFLHVYFDRCGNFTDWITTHEAGLAAARRSDDRTGEAWLRSSLGAALVLLERPAEAIRHLRRASRLHHEAGQDTGHANTLNTLGIAHAQFGDTSRSLRCLERALAIRRQTGDLHGQVMTLGNMAMAYGEAAQFAPALRYAEQALQLARQTGDEQLEGNALANIGDLLRATGSLDEAINVLGQAVSIQLEAASRLHQAEALNYLGLAYAERGEPDQARAAWARALSLYGPLQDASAAKIRHSLESLARS